MTSDQLERRCTATSKRSGNRCKRPAIEGGTVCTMHGGNAPQVRQAAARRLVFAQVREEFNRLGQAAPVDTAEAMLEAVYEAAANVAYLRKLVGSLTSSIEAGLAYDDGDEEIPDDVRAAMREELGAGIAGRVDPGNWKAAPHVWVTMYNDERERMVRFAKMCREANVDERRIELAEEDGRRLVDVLLIVLDGFLASFMGRKVTQPLAEEFRRVEFMPLVQQAIETTGRAA